MCFHYSVLFCKNNRVAVMPLASSYYTRLDTYIKLFGCCENLQHVGFCWQLEIYERKTVNIGTDKVRVILEIITEALLISFTLSDPEIVAVRLLLLLRHNMRNVALVSYADVLETDSRCQI